MGLEETKPSLVFFGNERLATGVQTTAPALQALIRDGYDIKAVVSNYEPGTSRSSRQLEIQAVADESGIPVLLPNKPVDILEDLRNLGAEAAVLVAYGRIVPQSVIDLFPSGIINIHPSLLPLHRGPTPIESVLLSGEPKTGVSVMCLTAEMDAGPVFGQSELILNGSETKQELADKLIDIGGAILIELLPGILNGNIIAKPQDNSLATYDKLINKKDGEIDWTKPAQRLEREIRAYVGWPKSFVVLAGKELIITRAHAIASEEAMLKPGGAKVTEDRQLLVQAGSGSLIIDRLKPSGKNEMTASDFLAGYGKHL
ncbi:methionyl-tRNA formyltransferase [soil metagenome]